MSDVGQIGLSALFGVLLGMVFFGGLFWTVQRGLQSQRPALTFVVSYFVRIFFVAICFWWMASHQWGSLPTCLCALVATRSVFTRLTRRGQRHGA